MYGAERGTRDGVPEEEREVAEMPQWGRVSGGGRGGRRPLRVVEVTG
ncbi:nickel-type superoxide dismutase maturation protease, partial [Streptomyces cavourensis]